MSERNVATNKKARFKYTILETMEAGLSLIGSEVKSIREGKASLSDAYAIIKKGEVYLLNAHISEYKNAAGTNHKPRRTRKLLLHKREILRLSNELQKKGLTLIPIRLYFKRGRVKIELALAKGKKLFDKRQAIKEKETKKRLRNIRRQ